MPFKGFLCAITGEPVTPDQCLTCSHTGGLADETGLLCPWTPPLVAGLIEQQQPRDLPGYSVTELLGCPRALALRAKTDYWLTLQQAYWLYRGTVFHTVLQAALATDPTALVEQRFSTTIGGVTLTGQPDLVCPATGRLVDYKTTKRVPQPTVTQTERLWECPNCGARWSMQGLSKGRWADCGQCRAHVKLGADADILEPEMLGVSLPEANPHHVQQVNLYAWLLAQNGIAIAAAEILYLDMDTAVRVPVELWPLDVTEVFLQERIAALTALGADGLPPGVQDDPAQNWLCRYCPVADACTVRAAAATDVLWEDAAANTQAE